MQRSRQHSRRSACDRCRNYKLRCERASTQGNGCERCLKTGVLCVTTTPPGLDSRSIRGPHSSPRNSSNGPRVMCPSIAPSRDHQTRESNQPQMDLDMGSPPYPSPIDLNLSNFNFNENPSIQPISPKRNGHVRRESLTSSSFGELVEFSDSAVGFTPTSDGNLPENRSSPLKDLLELCASLVDDHDILKNNDPCLPYTNAQSPIETAVQHALSRTSKFSDILKAMVAAETAPLQQPNNNDVGVPQGRSSLPVANNSLPTPYSASEPQSRQGDSDHLSRSEYTMNLAYTTNSESNTTMQRRKIQDVTLTTTLVTTYILTMRAWRSIFSQIHRLLLTTPQGANSRQLMLPSLQLGGIPLRNNSSLKILVLLELSSSMLQIIETCLGINNSAGYAGGAADTGQVERLALSMDPVSVSVRETLLSQEMLRSAAEDGLGGLSLKGIMDEVKSHLDRTG
ncbi:hypothetical protein F4779DRAFT_365768 [Xylariaceae sp. FL0662B]|nr:hypothetical protein F4779DRAFT_365768 [Xylariaceae sp. FL0662B]